MAEEPRSGDTPAEQKTREELEAELEALRTEPADKRPDAGTRIRGVVSIVLVVLTAMGILVSAISWWVHYVAFDTDAFMQVVEPAVTSEEFTDALGTRLGEEAVVALDLETRLETRLTALDRYLSEQLIAALELSPRVTELLSGLDVPRFADLAGPISTAANERIASAIENRVASEGFETLMLTLIRRGHLATVALVTDDLESLENVYVDGDEVRWNAIPLVVSTLEFVIEEGLLEGEELTLPDLSDNPGVSAAISRLREALDSRIPDDFGQITVMGTDDLEALQAYGATFDRGTWLLTILTVVLIAATLAVSPRRRRTLIQLSVATVIAIVLAGVAIRATVGAIQQGIVSPEGRAAAGTVLVGIRESAQSVGVAILLISILVGVLAWLAGRPEQIEKWLESGRRAVARDAEANGVDLFVGRHLDVLLVVVTLLALVVVWVAELNWVWGLVLLAVIGGLFWYGLSARARYELAYGEAAESEESVLATTQTGDTEPM